MTPGFDPRPESSMPFLATMLAAAMLIDLLLIRIVVFVIRTWW